MDQELRNETLYEEKDTVLSADEEDLIAFETRAEAEAKKRYLTRILLIGLLAAAFVATALVIWLVPFSGQTPEGLCYEYYIEIIGDRGVTVTGYVGDGETVTIPNKIGGSSVVKILPDAFGTAPGLRQVNIAAAAHLDRDLFYNCQSLRVVWFEHKGDVCELNLPRDCYSYADQQDVGIGFLHSVTTHDDRICGTTTDGTTVVLDLSDHLTQATVDEEWICAGALSGSDEKITIHLGQQTMFDASLYEKVEWGYENYSQAHCWVYSCKIAQKVQLTPDPLLLRAAFIRAGEVQQSNTFTRPDGSQDKDLLNELGVQWTDGGSQKHVIIQDTQKMMDVLNGMISACKKAKCDRIAVAFRYDDVNEKTYVYGFWVK